jgi:hypothetical protein
MTTIDSKTEIESTLETSFISIIHQAVNNGQNKRDVKFLSFSISFRKEVSNFEIQTVIGRESGGTPSCAGGATPVSSPCCDSLHLQLGTAYLARPAWLYSSLQYRTMCIQAAHNFFPPKP